MSKSSIARYLQSGGVYTCMRVNTNNGIFAYREHLLRVANVKTAITRSSIVGYSPLDTEEIEQFLLPQIKKAIEEGRSWITGDMRITVAVRRKKEFENVDPNNVCVEHLESMVTANEIREYPETVQLDTMYVSRSSTLKNGEWACLRDELDERRRERSNDIIMIDSKGNIKEGLTSNISVVSTGGELIVPPDNSILEGTMLKLLMNVARSMGLPVRRQFPNIGLLNGYQSVLVSSTSRTVIPANSIYNPSGSIKIVNTGGSIEKILVEEVKNNIEKNSVKLFD